MKTATFTQFRRNAKAYFDSVEQGEMLQITRHGKVIAQLLPARPLLKKVSWKSPALKLSVPGVSLSRIILQERDEAA